MSQRTDLTKAEIKHLFREARGLHRFGDLQQLSLRMPYFNQTPVQWRHENPGELVEPIHLTFTLELFHICREQWACIHCNGHVIVPPFEWQGFEFLSSHVW